MPVPVIAAVALTASAAVGTAYSQYMQGKAQRSYYDFLSEQSLLKSRLASEAAEETAGYAQDEASRMNSNLNKAVKQIDASQKTALIASGISLESVTAQDIANDTYGKQKLDEMAIRYNAELKGYQARKAAILTGVQAAAEAGGFQAAGNLAYGTGIANAQSSLIGGAGNALSNYIILDRGNSNKYGNTTSYTLNS